VSVIVPVRNGGPTLARALEALANNDYHSFELIVVDDGSSDGSREVGEAAGATVLNNRRSRGPAGARNTGVDAARGDIVPFIDADVEVQPTTIARVVERFDANPDLAAMFGAPRIFYYFYSGVTFVAAWVWDHLPGPSVRAAAALPRSSRCAQL
jgi:glycosyltransferase involved in cell wall biosynthesis